MRRKDRERSREEGLRYIDEAPYGTLALARAEGAPLLLPLSLARIGEKLYFHSAKAGEKVAALRGRPEVTLAFVAQAETPRLLGRAAIGHPAPGSEEAERLAPSLFTTEYRSAIVRGRVSPVEDEAERERAMRAICERFTPELMAYFPDALKGLPHTDIYRVDIRSLSAKAKLYDAEGREIKGGA